LTDHTAAFRRCLIDLDVVGIREMWAQVAPYLPQPSNEHEAWITLHYARTQAESIPDRARCYSHAWLCERSLPSGLPDRLKAKADRLYPREVKAVGIAVKAMSSRNEPYARAVERAMSDAVIECYADGVADVDVIKARMAAARARV
jgi:hypothetical protein